MKTTTLAAVVVLAGTLAVGLLGNYSWRQAAIEHHNQHEYSTRVQKEFAAAMQEREATKSLPVGDSRRVRSIKRYADLLVVGGQYDEAERNYAAAWIEKEEVRKKVGKYDPEFVDVMLATAAFRIDQRNFPDAEDNYKTILWYDKTYKHEREKQDIARDLDNLGVCYYFIGLSRPTIAQGAPDFKLAIDNFDQAIQAYRELYGPGSQRESNVLANKALAARDAGDEESAKKSMQESRRILSLTPRPTLLP